MDPGRSPMFTIKYIYKTHIFIGMAYPYYLKSSLRASRPIRGQLSNEPARLSTNQRPAFK